MRRREFLTAASGAAGAAAVMNPAAAQEDETPTPGGNETATDGAGNETDAGDSEGGGGTETVSLVDYAFEPATSSPLYITPGTTVNFVWETNQHNIIVDSQPEESEWAGYEDIEDAGFEYSHTFEVEGEYEFHCRPHVDLGMEGTIIVNEEGAAAEGEAAGPVDPHEMGVHIQEHWVGVGANLGIFTSLVFAFYVLKYGTTPHTGYPEED